MALWSYGYLLVEKVLQDVKPSTNLGSGRGVFLLLPLFPAETDGVSGHCLQSSWEQEPIHTYIQHPYIHNEVTISWGCAKTKSFHNIHENSATHENLHENIMKNGYFMDSTYIQH